MVTNGKYAFVLFMYNKVEWITGAYNGGDYITGLGGIPAQVGPVLFHAKLVGQVVPCNWFIQLDKLNGNLSG